MSPHGDELPRWTSETLGALVAGIGGRFVAPISGDSVDRLATAARNAGVSVVRSRGHPISESIAGGTILPSLNDLRSETIPLLPIWRMTDYRRRLLALMIADGIAALASSQPVLVISSHEKSDAVLAEAGSMLRRRADYANLAWVVADDPAAERTRCATTSAPHDPVEMESENEIIHMIVTLTAIAPVALTVDDLSALTGCDEDDVRSAIPQAVTRGMLRQDADLILPAGLHVVDAIISSVSTAMRAGLRRAIIVHLSRRGLPAALLLDVEIETGFLATRTHAHSIDVSTRDLAVAAMKELREISPREAIAFGEQAMSLFRADDDPDLPFVADVLLALLWQTSRTRTAVEVVSRVFTGRTPHERDAYGMLWLARLETTASRGLQLTEAGLKLTESDSLIHTRLNALRLYYLARLGFARTVSAEAPVALLSAAIHDDDEAQALLHLALSSARFQESQFREARDLAGVAVARLRIARIPLSYWGIPALWQARIQHALGDSAGALTLYDDIAAHAEREGNTSVLNPLTAMRASAALSLGLVNEVASMLAPMQEHQLPQIEDRMESVAIRTKLLVALLRGDRDALGEVDRALEPPCTGNDDASLRRAAWRLILAYEFDRQDDADEAAADLRSQMKSQVEVLPWTDPEDDVILARACLALQHSDLADRCVRSARGRRQQNPQDAMAQAVLAHIEGLVFDDSTKLNTAIAQWRSLRRPLLEADAHIALGEASEREALRSGLSSFEAAHRILYRAGAARSAARVRRVLRVGGRSAPRSLGAPQAKSDGLTWMQREVAEHAVLGHSASQIADDLFLSRHTVVAHLRSIYIKLGIASREELQKWALTSSHSTDAPRTDDLDQLLP